MIRLNHLYRIHTNMQRWLSFPFIMLLLIAPPCQADVRSMLDRTTIYDGDTVTLTIEAVGPDRDVDPDLGVLEEDFTIVGTSSSRQIQIINGRRSDKQQWRVELDPKHIGEIRIPAIAVGTATTAPLTLRIEEAPASVADGGEQPVFLRMEIDDSDTNPFVQQQIRLNLRLFYRLPLVEGNFDNPQPENAVVERLGDDRKYQTTIDGQAYEVVERHYAIFPEKSGELVIPSVSFTGRVASAAAQRTPSGQFDSMIDRFFTRNLFGEPGKRIRVRSQPLSLEVRARPENYQSGYWLPSEKLVLEDSWAQGPPELRVGEPITRTISLRAKGLESSQLPDIEVTEVEHMRIYPEQVVVENHTDGDWVFGTRRQNIAYVPSRAGPVTLPEIRINWWDTVNGKPQTTIIPAWELNVLPGIGDNPTTVPPVQAAAGSSVEDTPKQKEPLGRTATDPALAANTWLRNYWPWLDYWPWLAAAAVLLTAVGVIAVRRRNRPSPAPAPAKPAAPGNSEIRRILQQACEQNDPQSASSALLIWASKEWPEHPPRSLGSLVKRIDTGIEQVKQLEHVLYAPGHGQWNGSALWREFSENLSKRITVKKSTDDAGLSPLYPDWKHRQA